MTVVNVDTGEIVETLTLAERENLAADERIIERGLGTFVEVGEALARIRDSRLYRSTHGTFEDYCQERWGLTRRHVNRLVDAAETVASLGPMGPTLVTSERQARVLAPVVRDHGPDVARRILDRVAQTAGRITAAALTDAVKADPVVNQAEHDRWNDLYAEHKQSGVHDALMAERPYADAITGLHMAARDINDMRFDAADVARHVPLAFTHCLPAIRQAADTLRAFVAAIPEENQ